MKFLGINFKSFYELLSVLVKDSDNIKIVKRDDSKLEYIEQKDIAVYELLGKYVKFIKDNKYNGNEDIKDLVLVLDFNEEFKNNYNKISFDKSDYEFEFKSCEHNVYVYINIFKDIYMLGSETSLYMKDVEWIYSYCKKVEYGGPIITFIDTDAD